VVEDEIRSRATGEKQDYLGRSSCSFAQATDCASKHREVEVMGAASTEYDREVNNDIKLSPKFL
jgi:hypothetical protein